MEFPFPSTPQIEILLTKLGFVKTSHPASWQDVGDAENGPKLVGGPAFDKWVLGNRYVYVKDGQVQAVETEQP